MDASPVLQYLRIQACVQIQYTCLEQNKSRNTLFHLQPAKMGAFGLTEPMAGSDVSGTRTTAVRDGDEFYCGTKIFITNGYYAILM